MEKIIPMARARARKARREALEKVLTAARDLIAYRGQSQVEAHSLFFSLQIAVNAASTFPTDKDLQKIKAHPFFES